MWGPVNAGGGVLPAPLVLVVPLRPLLGPLVVAGKMVPPPTSHNQLEHDIAAYTSQLAFIDVWHIQDIHYCCTHEQQQ